MLFFVQEMARLAKQEYEEQTRKDQELHDQIAAERAEAKYKKHYETCHDVVDQILDFAGKVAEYRELTNKLVLFTCWILHFCPVFKRIKAQWNLYKYKVHVIIIYRDV